MQSINSLPPNFFLRLILNTKKCKKLKKEKELKAECKFVFRMCKKCTWTKTGTVLCMMFNA